MVHRPGARLARRSRPATLVLALLVSGLALSFETAPAAAQSPAGKPDEPASRDDFKEEVTVRVAELQILVTDREGRPIRDLRPDEIQVTEAGEKRKIAHLEPFATRDLSVRLLPRPMPLIGPTVQSGAAPEPAPAFPPPPPRRQIAILFDGANSRPQDRPRWLAAAKQWIETEMREGDLVMIAVIDRGGVRTVQPFSTSRGLLLQVLSSTSFFPPAEQVDLHSEMSTLLNHIRSCQTSPTYLSCASNAASPTVFEWQARAERIIGALRAFVATLAALPGRKVVLYASNGIVMDAGTLASDAILATFGTERVSLTDARMLFHARAQGEMLDMTRVAAASDVTFFTFDTRSSAKREGSTDVEQAESLNERRFTDPYASAFDQSRAAVDIIATRTGGRGLHGPAIEKHLPAAANAIEGLYTVGYYRDPTLQGAPKVRIKVARKGADVTFPDRYDPLRGLPLSVGLEMGIGRPQTTGSGVALPVTVQLPMADISYDRAPENTWVATLAIYVEAVAPDGTRGGDVYEVVESALPDQVYANRTGRMFQHVAQLPLSPGSYRIRVRVSDGQFKRASERAVDITLGSDFSVRPGIQNPVRERNPVREGPPDSAADPVEEAAK